MLSLKNRFVLVFVYMREITVTEEHCHQLWDKMIHAKSRSLITYLHVENGFIGLYLK